MYVRLGDCENQPTSHRSPHRPSHRLWRGEGRRREGPATLTAPSCPEKERSAGGALFPEVLLTTQDARRFRLTSPSSEEPPPRRRH
jgi:hypothetical protein